MLSDQAQRAPQDPFPRTDGRLNTSANGMARPIGLDMRRSRMDRLMDLHLLLEELREITSLPLGPLRAARVQQLSESLSPDLIDGYKTRLAQLGLKLTNRQETDRE